MFPRDIDPLMASTSLDQRNDTVVYQSGENGAVAIDDNATFQNGDNGHTASLWIIYYVLLLLIGSAGNIFVTYILATRQYMKEKYIFTSSVSIAHLLFCLLVLLIAIAFSATNEKILQTICNVIVCFLLGVTSYSMLTQAIRRFLALSERFRFANFTYQGKIINTALIWAISAVIALPYVVSDGKSMYYILLDSHNRPTETSNSVNNATDNTDRTNLSLYSWMSHSSDKTTQIPEMTSEHAHYHWLWIYSIVLLCIQAVLPSLISLVLLSLTLRGILRRPNQTHWVKEVQITKQHVIMQIIYLICWIPVLTMNLVHAVDDSILRKLVPNFQLLAHSIVIYYPILYFFINAHIQREMKAWFSEVTSRFRERTIAS